MEMITDLATCLKMRGVTQLQFARELGMTPANFGNVYAHAVRPQYRKPWRRVLDKAKTLYHIDYTDQRGWYCMTDDEWAEYIRKSTAAINHMLMSGIRRKSNP